MSQRYCADRNALATACYARISNEGVKDLRSVVEGVYREAFDTSHSRDLETIIVLKRHFMAMLDQGCGTFNREKKLMEYDSRCISAWGDAIRMAVSQGWIETKQATRW